MAAVSAVASPTTGSSAASSSGSTKASLTEQDFLQMLTAQLQDQNPLSPTDPQEIANEFAEMATVGGINELTTEVSQIQSSGAAAELAQAAGLVGKTIAVPGDTLVPSSSGVAEGAFEMPAAGNATVTIRNGSGAPVGTIHLGNLAVGLTPFSWSGGSAGQNYTFSVSASGTNGAAFAATPYSAAQVQAVDLSQSAPSVSIDGGGQEVPLSSIAGILGG